MSRTSFVSILAVASIAALGGAQRFAAELAEHRYTFDEATGGVVRDAVGGAPGALGPDAVRTGGAIRFRGNARSYVSWDRLLGQFGTDDFAVALRLRLNRTDALQEVLGNRSTYGHGNFFGLRVNGGRFVVEIDQDEEGTNYAAAVSQTRVDDGRWHRVRVLRNNRRLTLEIDGKLQSVGEGRGVANVRNDAPFRAGVSLVAGTNGGFLRGELDDLVFERPASPQSFGRSFRASDDVN